MSKLPILKGDPLIVLKTALEKWGTFARNRPLFSLQKTNPQKVLQVLSKMGNGTSHGRDEIDLSSIKLAADLLADPLCHLINISISTKTFASKSKVARIIPLHKGKGTFKDDPANYRPISLLPAAAKITERIIQGQMIDFLENTNQINYNHHTYQRFLSTTTTMMHLYDSIFEATENNKIAALVTIDESAAFDCIPHKLLIEKL